ncbi:hypothetical protein YYC_01849 [Plasmodium yoelii 17X]|uniref:Uncharacterized protein n=3 Tax=Plasmodium yoelii TaxID=5861 RepID=A0AAE9WUE5_PLAYO|nr:conserved Plasmodium protein, unknown function [Plasmodium yoelii]ETB60884.1 hypothetical protein YYC_01849 [Plasmodium yoelii 17X]WBY58659.1 hypothetical protein Py17XNL_001105654 [Plasmodium yoelii yoelii]CDU18946.1 conserved Plasmodium protein, unknown function [Plasmodium yoelii]VTZ79531.1 conserved Plasmodium protein, unknown function [Plasmodium yoelii]|eukprot:XP_022812418.1 conserved Plasmodium protein, unknown function [Plasmodium yoelii]
MTMKLKNAICRHIFRYEKNKYAIFVLQPTNFSTLKRYTTKNNEYMNGKVKTAYILKPKKNNFSYDQKNNLIDNDIFLRKSADNKDKINKEMYKKLNTKIIENSNFFQNDKLFYNYITCKVVREVKNLNYITSDFFYHLNKFHINFINNNSNFFFLKFTKTCKIFFGVLFSFSLLLTLFLVSSSNYLEYNIILKYHIKFHSLLFSFFSAYYLALQIGNYYFKNNFHYIYTLTFLVNSVISMFMADYNIWGSYYFLSLNYLSCLAINYCNIFLKTFPIQIFRNTNKLILFSLLSSYLAVNKGKYIEKNIELLNDEDVDIRSFKLFKILPYFL